MPSRNQKFSERARRVLSLAQEEAQRFNHNYIGTEYILLGLLRETEGSAARVLASLNVELAKVRSAVEFIIGRPERPTPAEIGLTPRAKKVIEYAVEEARRDGSDIITVHLLIGVIREGEGVAAEVLDSLGVTLEKVRGEAGRVRSQDAGQPSGSEMGSGDDSIDPISGWSRVVVAVANKLRATRKAKNEAIDNGEYERASRLRDREFELAEQFKMMQDEWPRP